MDRRKLVGLVVALVGLVIGVVFVLADALGLTDDPTTFDLDTIGTYQAIGIVVGVIVLVVGLGIYQFGERFLGGGSSGE